MTVERRGYMGLTNDSSFFSEVKQFLDIKEAGMQ